MEVDIKAISSNFRRSTDCNILAVNKDGTTESKIINKQNIINMTKLHFRDIRLHIPNQAVGVSIRETAIIVNIFYIKAIIMSHVVLLYDSEHDHRVQQIATSMQEKIASDQVTPFEFIMLECILNDICNYVTQQYDSLENECKPLLEKLLSDPTQRKSLQLLPIKNDLKKLEIYLQSIYKSVGDILENDEEMAEMYLTRKNQGDDPDIEEIEDLLELYFSIMGDISSKITVLETDIADTDDTVLTMLDISRNKLMVTGLWVNIFTLILGGGAFIVGVFGMNLKNSLERSSYGFGVIISCIVILMAIFTIIFFCKYRKIKI